MPMKEENKTSADKKNDVGMSLGKQRWRSTSAFSRRKLLSSFGLAIVAFLAGRYSLSGFLKTRTKDVGRLEGAEEIKWTSYLKMKKTNPLDADAVNVNLDQLDSEISSRGVTPDMYKSDTDPDDTRAVQAAFNSGRTVIFTRNYYVKSVRMSGIEQTIDFNGYWLWGISKSEDTEAERDCVLEITGLYLQLFNIKVVSKFNTNYKCGVHWYSIEASKPAEHIKIFGLQINCFLVGLQFGAYLDEPDPLDTSQSENYIFGIHFRSVQNCLVLNQPNGVLKIMGGVIDCSPYEWNTVQQSPYQHKNAYCFYNKDAALIINCCDILKVVSDEGYGFKGSNFILNNCTIEIGSTWGYIEGKASISQNNGGFQGGATKNLFEIAPDAKGRLQLNQFYCKRTAGVGDISVAHIVSGLENASEYRVVIDKSEFRDWADYRVTYAYREHVHIRNTWFHFIDSHSNFYEVTIDDLPAAEGFMIKSPNGTYYKVTIDNEGTLSTQLVLQVDE